MSGRVQRAFPRVQHRTALRVVRDEHGPTGPVADAETVNLGLGGLAFETATSFQPQEAIDCELTIGGRPTLLSGKVAWSTSLADGRQRCGVAFTPLPHPKRDLLYQAVTAARAGGKPITLRFIDMNRRVEARALADTGGLRIRAPFPMLTAGTRVSLEEASAETSVLGQITAVELDRSGPIPVLEFVVALDSWPGQAQARAHDSAVPAPSTPPAAEPEAAGVDHEVAITTPPPPIAPPSIGPADPGSMAQPPPLKPPRAAGASTTPTPVLSPELEAAQAPPAEAAPRLDGHSDSPQPPRHRSGHGLRTRTLAFVALLAIALVAVALAVGPLRDRVPFPVRHEAASTALPATEPSTTAPAAGSEQGLAAEGTAAPSEASEKVDDNGEAPPAVQQLHAPEVIVEGQATLVRVPVTGEADGMVVQLWKQPPGIALQLPNATITLPARRYPIKRGRIAHVRVGEPGQRTSFQAVVQQPIRTHDIQIQGDVLTVRIGF